jgi:hypothetical protein
VINSMRNGDVNKTCTMHGGNEKYISTKREDTVSENWAQMGE